MKKLIRYSFVLLGVMFIVANLGVGYVCAQEESKPEPFALDGTEWTVQMFYTDTKGEQASNSDKLIFKDGKFTTEGQEERGFKESNYTLSVKGGATIFETMQSKDEDRAFWRGEVKDNNVRGILSIHYHKGKDSKEIKDYTFGGPLTSGAIKETEKVRRERIAAEKAAKEAKERAAREKAEREAIAVEEATAMAAAQVATVGEEIATQEATQTNTTDQGIGEKVRGLWDRIVGKDK